MTATAACWPLSDVISWVFTTGSLDFYASIISTIEIDGVVCSFDVPSSVSLSSVTSSNALNLDPVLLDQICILYLEFCYNPLGYQIASVLLSLWGLPQLHIRPCCGRIYHIDSIYGSILRTLDGVVLHQFECSGSKSIVGIRPLVSIQTFPSPTVTLPRHSRASSSCLELPITAFAYDRVPRLVLFLSMGTIRPFESVEFPLVSIGRSEFSDISIGERSIVRLGGPLSGGSAGGIREGSPCAREDLFSCVRVLR
ncbi:hypothetical protein F3Y22_tig00112530pilonHSYRG00275 [Hibiscus syriacus]|uniref:Uncharacterized protein n=1 Tax=Hibiscus syriacus TaxID=106335 RepID=A0A6A2XUT9_HIBSY|nr:hypothetical protein F3Y22_tig00112530pilonHSYRG00275 [Hibiscus syriacus]